MRRRNKSQTRIEIDSRSKRTFSSALLSTALRGKRLISPEWEIFPPARRDATVIIYLKNRKTCPPLFHPLFLAARLSAGDRSGDCGSNDEAFVRRFAPDTAEKIKIAMKNVLASVLSIVHATREASRRVHT
jgi:hypothetical protein